MTREILGAACPTVFTPTCLVDIGKTAVTPVPPTDLESLVHQIPGRLAKKLPKEIGSPPRARDEFKVSSSSCKGDPC